MNFVMTAAVVLALIGSALVAGVFFAFSSFVMKALAKLPCSEGIAAMQSINEVVLNRSFLGTFIGTALTSVLVVVLAVGAWDAFPAPWYLAGALLYFVGTFLVTAWGNVPLNEELAEVSAVEPDSVRVWKRYLDSWTLLNTVRTIAAAAATLSFTFGLLDVGAR